MYINIQKLINILYILYIKDIYIYIDHVKI